MADNQPTLNVDEPLYSQLERPAPALQGSANDDVVLTIAEPTQWKDAEEDTNIIAVAPATEFDGTKLDSLDTVKVNLVKYSHEELVRLIRSLPGLTSVQIRIIELRYCTLLTTYSQRLLYIDAFYHASRAIISLGGVAVPAMLSIQSPTSSNPSIGLYWTTWTISLVVTVLHNFTTIFRFDKKFFGIHSVYERLVSEGWQYMELGGRYAGHFGKCIPTHANQFLYFMNSIERIKLKQVQDEFNAAAAAEADKEKSGQAEQTTVKQLVPSPFDMKLNRAAK
uniref:Uncharacterized protein n=1 Tax=viral metagenome TaxID=1070528 RepID=A0A6C0DTG7_9ZZZZ